MTLKKTESFANNLSQYGFAVKIDSPKKSWQSSMPNFANVAKNTYLGIHGSVCDLPSLETNNMNQSSTEHNYHYRFDKDHDVVATIGFLESDDKQFLLAHGKFNATIKVSTSTFYVNGQFNKHFIARINCTNNDKFNSDIQCLCNRSGSYAVHKFLHDIFVKDVQQNSNKTNNGYKIHKKIYGLELQSIVKVGLILFVMYQLSHFSNQHNAFNQT